MGLEQISTGYKPEFALGALYQGYNAGNADNAAQLANLKAQWDLQKSQYDDPLKSIENELAAHQAMQLDNPDSLAWYQAGKRGQSQSLDAAGRMAQDTYDTTRDHTNAKNVTDLEKLKNLIELYKSQGSDIAGLGNGQIGMPMQPQEQPTQGTIGFPQGTPNGVGREQFNAAVPPSNGGFFTIPPGAAAKQKNLFSTMGTDYRSGSKPYDLETIDKEIRLHGDPTGELAKERARIVAELAAGGGGTDVNPGVNPSNGSGATSPATFAQAPQQGGGNIPFFNAPATRSSQIAQILATDPELAKTIYGEQVKGIFHERASQNKHAVDNFAARNDTTIRGQNMVHLDKLEAALGKDRDQLRKINDKETETAFIAQLLGGIPNASQAQKDAATATAKKQITDLRSSLQDSIRRNTEARNSIHSQVFPNMKLPTDAPIEPERTVIKLQ